MRMVLVQQDQVHVVGGASVGFDDFDQCLRYSGIDLSRWRSLAVTYEPDRNVCVVFDGVSTMRVSDGDAIAEFDQLIAMAPVLKERIANIFWGKTHAEIREIQWLLIQAERDRRMDGGFKVEVAPGDFRWFHSDSKSRIQQLGLFAAGAAVPAVQWKTMDGSFVTMSQPLATAIFAAASALDTALFANGEAHLAAMTAAADPEAYDYSTGWPAAYGDEV